MSFMLKPLSVVNEEAAIQARSHNDVHVSRIKALLRGHGVAHEETAATKEEFKSECNRIHS